MAFAWTKGSTTPGKASRVSKRWGWLGGRELRRILPSASLPFGPFWHVSLEVTTIEGLYEYGSESTKSCIIFKSALSSQSNNDNQIIAHPQSRNNTSSRRYAPDVPPNVHHVVNINTRICTLNLDQAPCPSNLYQLRLLRARSTCASLPSRVLSPRRDRHHSCCCSTS